jgi:hypothetical protein
MLELNDNRRATVTVTSSGKIESIGILQSNQRPSNIFHHVGVRFTGSVTFYGSRTGLVDVVEHIILAVSLHNFTDDLACVQAGHLKHLSSFFVQREYIMHSFGDFVNHFWSA